MPITGTSSRSGRASSVAGRHTDDDERDARSLARLTTTGARPLLRLRGAGGASKSLLDVAAASPEQSVGPVVAERERRGRA